MDIIRVTPIGTVVGGRTEPIDDNWGDVRSVVRIDSEQFGEDTLAGLGDFSHLEVVYRFDRADPAKITTGARHPRNREDWPKVGIFAQRGKNRPNLLGVSRCRIIAIDGHDIHVRELDAIDGTPVLDVKPYLHEFAPIGDVRQPVWATELMRSYYD
ncbi:SAM-dependent methyltransferase [Solicola gregarius]|uniref:SAM-dependent methyltransferase n=1 Tax=Solicola gregarius TaxID=2908642 RepID=A0AA46YKD0_9ACTN|nr:SAM-dependent methyltransferase [Solicola gregarius]UYM04346.1 SAM-dependent methyltransferase [Solicola gregarius]